MFGHDSFRKHKQQADDKNIPYEVYELPNIALDIDEPADIEHLKKSNPLKENRVLTQEVILPKKFITHGAKVPLQWEVIFFPGMMHPFTIVMCHRGEMKLCFLFIV